VKALDPGQQLFCRFPRTCFINQDQWLVGNDAYEILSASVFAAVSISTSSQPVRTMISSAVIPEYFFPHRPQNLLPRTFFQGC